VVLWNDDTMEEYVFPMIKKMTAIPAEFQNNFGTAQANMSRVVVRVVEGESTVPSECTPLGLCSVELPPYLPKSSPVELTYCYNSNQVLEVIVDAFGKQNRVTIQRNTGLSEDEMASATMSLSLIKVE
jgi:molecular chaperone DnaK